MQTQTPEYWASKNFALTDSDIEQIYNFLIETEEPQTVEKLTQVIIRHRVAEEQRTLERVLKDRTIYQPKLSFTAGEELIFPAQRFTHGTVKEVRTAFNPQFGEFAAAKVEMQNGKLREYAAELDTETHPLNQQDPQTTVADQQADPDEIFSIYGRSVGELLADDLDARSEFIRLSDLWFVKGLLVEINAGHLHLAEAVLDMYEGGPIETPEIMVHLDLPADLSETVREFSLNYALQQDKRFDEVAPPDKVQWFLHRSEPNHVRDTPLRLQYHKVEVDRDIIGPHLKRIERDIDDEWSQLSPSAVVQPVRLALPYHHRAMGTLPLSSRLKPLFPAGISSRQIVTFIDEAAEEEIQAWVSHEGRYIYGLADWYAENKIPVGGYLTVSPTEKVGRYKLSAAKRPRDRKEWIRVGYVDNGNLRFKLENRPIGCDYDELMIVGTDAAAAIDVLFKKYQDRPIDLILTELFTDLGQDTTQNAVHAKTLYSAVNMLRRVPPAAVFTRLVSHRAFISVGDEYWQFDSSKWQG